jgi:hypothetical protein
MGTIPFEGRTVKACVFLISHLLLNSFTNTCNIQMKAIANIAEILVKVALNTINQMVLYNMRQDIKTPTIFFTKEREVGGG